MKLCFICDKELSTFQTKYCEKCGFEKTYKDAEMPKKQIRGESLIIKKIPVLKTRGYDKNRVKQKISTANKIKRKSIDKDLWKNL